MKDLSTGSIPRHIASMSIQMGVGIVVQTLYFFTDLYFVSKLGDQAIAGVTSAGNVWFIVLALTQILNVGTVALVSHAVGAQQRDRANLVFNQSLVLSLVMGAVVFAGVYLASAHYMHTVAADDSTARAGIEYLYWFAPGLALQFPMVAMFATLRATGMIKPTMILQVITVFVNIVLAPIFIVGWLTGHAFGPAGAGLASSISIAVGIVLCAYYFRTHEKYVAVHAEQLRAQMAVWGRLLLIGLPVGLEFMLMSLVMAIIYWLIRDFGSAAQAGARARDVPLDHRVQHPDHDAAHGAVPVRVAVLHAHLHARGGGGAGRRADADDHVVEFCGQRRDLQLLVDVPGAGQHLAHHRVERRPRVDLRRAGAVAIYPAGIPARGRVVRLAGEHVRAGVSVLFTGAPGVRAQAGPRTRPSGVMGTFSVSWQTGTDPMGDVRDGG